MADLRIVDAPEIPTEDITGQEKLPTGGSGNYSITLDSVADYTKTKKDLADNTAVDSKVNGVRQELNTHIEDLLNPHQVTKGQIGLGNVDNTADADKPVSNSTQSAIISAVTPKADKSYVDGQLALKANKSDVYTKQESSDLVNNSISTALTPVNSSLDLAKRGIVNRYDPLFTYNSGERVVLTNGDIVKSTINGNTNNPNVDITGWVKTNDARSIVDKSGKTQQEVNDSVAKFYTTVSVMLADTTLKDGDTVATKGYHSISDAGGATYLISVTSTNYSIPLENGLHAVFRDDFDIRKFGIRNDETLDQTTEIGRMVAYADDRIYEIDFHNYKIMTPDIEQGIKTGVYRFLKGMIFNRPHIIKNLHIAHDKTKQLRYNTICIGFLPKADGQGVFKLDNVTFDPYVADFLLHPTSGDGDGNMHGFVAAWHGEFPMTWPSNQQFMTGYSIEYKNVNFISPAVSYNLAVGFWCENQTLLNCKGEYWGLYLLHFCDVLKVENLQGVFRDDLHTGSGRVLVTSLIHEEQEVGSQTFAYTQKSQMYKNISCVKKSNAQPYIAVKRMVLGAPVINKIEIEDVIGSVAFYAGADKAGLARIDNVYVRNNYNNVALLMDVVNTYVEDSTITSYLFTQPEFYATNVTLIRTKVNISIAYNGVTIDLVRLIACNLASTDGVARSSAYFKSVFLVDTDVNGGRVISGKFNKLHMLGGEVGTVYFSDFIRNTKDDGTSSTVRMNGVRFVVDKGDEGNLVSAVSGQPITARIRYCDFVSKPNFNLGTSGTLVYNYNTPVYNASKTYDPPSLAAGAVQSTTLTVSGVVLGDPVTCSFNQPLNGTRMWAEVTATNTVTVYHQNPTGSAVDVASGTLAVKLI